MNIIRFCLMLAMLALMPARAQTQAAVPAAAKAPAMVVEVTADRHIVVAGDALTTEELFKRLHTVFEGEPNAHILIRIFGEEGPYEAVGRVIYTIYRAGAKKGAIEFERQP